MQALAKTLVGTAILTLVGSACVDPGASFKAFDKRVLDAASTNVGGSCNGGEIPDVNGEFFLALSPSIAPDSLIKMIVTTGIDRTATPVTMTMTLQLLCSQADKCTVGQPVGDPVVLEPGEVSDDCGFLLVLTDVLIPGGANPISGGDIIGNLDLLGTLTSDDLYCGLMNGTAAVGGAPIPIDGSTFGAQRIVAGTLGDALPNPVFECPEALPEFDAGVPDAGMSDAGVPDADPADADLADANI